MASTERYRTLSHDLLDLRNQRGRRPDADLRGDIGTNPEMSGSRREIDVKRHAPVSTMAGEDFAQGLEKAGADRHPDGNRHFLCQPLPQAVESDDFRREYPPLGDVPEVETMGGLLMSLLEVVPNQGDSVTFRGLKLIAQAGDTIQWRVSARPLLT